MHAARFWLMALLVPVVLAAPDAVYPEDPPPFEMPDLAPWSDRALLEKHLTRACDAVEEVCGAKFTQRPKLAISTAEVLAPILVGELGPLFERLGQANATEMIREIAKLTAAKCEPDENTIHVLPGNVERIIRLHENASLASVDVLRVMLAHEAAHALDFQRFPVLDRARRDRDTLEGVQAAGAVIEGHAQFVAKRIAARWNLEESGFEKLVELTVGRPPQQGAVERVMTDILLAEMRFAYVDGHAFMEAVFAARGSEGVDRVLANPPMNVRLIERPQTYLEPGRTRRTIELDRVMAPGVALAKEIGWPTRSIRLKRVQFEAIFALLPKAKTQPVRDRFQDGWGLVIGSSQQQMAVGILMEFSSPSDADAYVALTRALLEEKDRQMAGLITSSKYEDGVGPKGALPGLVCTKVAGGQTVTVHATALDRFGLDITFVDTPVERPRQDELVKEVVDALRASLAAEAPSAAESEAHALEALAAEFGVAQRASDGEKLVILAQAVCPTTEDLRAICRKGPDTDAFVAAYRGPKNLRLEDPVHRQGLRALGEGLFAPGDPKETDIRVHAATTEELAAYARGTVAYAEFPGGMRRFAEKVAAPRRTWYVVELTEPQKDAGMKYTCFTRVGDRFVFVAKPWRAMPRSSGEK